MSTSIPSAFRVPLSDLNYFIDEARDFLLEDATSAILERMELVDLRQEEIPDFRTWKPKRAALYLIRRQFDRTMSEAVKAARSSMRSYLFDFESFINVWVSGEHAYCVVVDDRMSTYDWEPSLASAEDFSYWNNSDGPDHISEEEWDARKEKWEELTTDHNGRRLCHEVVGLQKRSRWLIIEQLWSMVASRLGCDDTMLCTLKRAEM